MALTITWSFLDAKQNPSLFRSYLVENFSNFQPYALAFREKVNFFTHFCVGAQPISMTGMMATNQDFITLHIDGMAHDGRGIGFLPGRGRGRAVFVANALPGQTALCRFVNEKKNMLEAALEKVLDAGPNTERPICPHADICGGCPLQRMPYSLQLYWKDKLLNDALTRIGGIDAETLKALRQPLVPSPHITAFRNKLTLAFGFDKAGNACLGMRRRESHEVFSLNNCGIVNSGALPVIHFMEQAMLSSGLSPSAHGGGFWKQLVLRLDDSSSSTPCWRAILLTSPVSESQKCLIAQISRKLLADVPTCSGFIHEVSPDTDCVKSKTRLSSLTRAGYATAKTARMEQLIAGCPFSVDAGSFMQVNSAAAQELVKLAMEMDSRCNNKKGLLDLYCGSGFPGQWLAGNYDKVLGIEIDPEAVVSARINAGKRKDWRYLQGNAGRILQSGKIPADWSTILLDPPRSGVDGGTLNWLQSAKPENIIYISCNPATLGRDLKVLGTSYELCKLGAVDMFPHTPHVEACALLRVRASCP